MRLFGKPKQNPQNLNIVLSLLVAMIAGRCVYGAVMWILTAIQGGPYTFAVFIGAVLLDSWPGWLLQLLAVPAVMYVLKSAHILENTICVPFTCSRRKRTENSKNNANKLLRYCHGKNLETNV